MTKKAKRTPLEKAVAHGLQAARPFHVEASADGDGEDDPRLLEDENARLAKKEISQVYNNS